MLLNAAKFIDIILRSYRTFDQLLLILPLRNGYIYTYYIQAMVVVFLLNSQLGTKLISHDHYHIYIVTATAFTTIHMLRM